MNPSFRVVVGAVICAAACTPNQGVKPGAPELIEFNVIQSGQPTLTGIGAVKVLTDTPDCTNTLATGDACLPNGLMADVADGGTRDADIKPDTVCRLASANHWCRCDPYGATWNCDPFQNVLAVVAVFDRLLDPAPLDPGDAAARDDIMMASVSSGAPAVTLMTDFAQNGDANGLFINMVFGPLFFGNFRGDGPSLFAVPTTTFPSSATIMVSFDGEKVRAKDGHTLSTGKDQLLSQTLIFSTGVFAATLFPPDAMAGDPTAVTLSFTNQADPTGHLIVTANGAAITNFEIKLVDGSTFAISPMGDDPWPTGATIVVTIDGSTTNLAGQTIDAPASVTFTAP